MTDRQVLVSQLIHHEGLRLKVYTDTVGKATIGVGRNLTDKGITSAEAMLLLDHDVDECLHDLETFTWFGTLDAVRQRVLVDLRFNLGSLGLRNFRAMLHAFAVGDFETAANEMLDSRAAQQNMDRYHRLARMTRTGEDEL